MFYTTPDWLPATFKKRSGDLGLDLPSMGRYIVKPGELKIVDTGIVMEFPFFGRARRFLSRVIFGHDVVGIGGHIWPRSIGNHIILAGVVDVGYRGSIKVKMYNPTDEIILIEPGDRIAQLVLMPCINPEMRHTTSLIGETDRGSQGGINVR